jgi:hypothetical protein
MSREPIRIERDGLSRLVYPCSIPGCADHCDPDFDSAFMCESHLGMVPAGMLADIDIVMAEAMAGVVPHSAVQETLDDVLAYAVAVDAIIRGDGL